MDFQFLKYETDDRVATITFNNPDRHNAINATMKKEFRIALAKAGDDPDIRVIIVTGAGCKAFSSGMDLGAIDIPQGQGAVAAWRDREADNLDFCYTVWNCSKPVIAQIEGYCFGPAFEFAQMCDIRYCSEDSKFGEIEARFSAGLPTLILPWIIGPRCRDLIYTGDTIGASEAKELGLVSRVFPNDRLQFETLKLAKRMSMVAIECLQWNKRAINHTYEVMGIRAALAYGLEVNAIIQGIMPPEQQEFERIRIEKGPKEAVKWRKILFEKYE
ncbi:enoyl-CoA hydratase/isomerase family protein [Bradyrhizobium elkanii]|uniref:enoyl-CoA hydratase/isomerase family protein n=1 Tax=Bradyrhizobium elkanii TaxID=29448 RepID=UPI001BA9D47D|nr:enoyl-CoA hydratase/isomerase family protein [Bradyrhizobium elkanii]MBR1165210.1 enoyl-CoA hydratase/isomerase family protein [Bradyrhizobium elkanii]